MQTITYILEFTPKPTLSHSGAKHTKQSIMNRHLAQKHFFISCATNEFGGYRLEAATKLEVMRFTCDYQENFDEHHFDTIMKLASKILRCQCFVHVFGNGIGTKANRASVEDFIRRLPQFDRILDTAGKPILDKDGKNLIKKCCEFEYSYTSWELILAKAFGKPIVIFSPSVPIADGHPKGKNGFDLSLEDQKLVARHRSFLNENHLKEIRSFKCVQTLVDGCVAAKNILDDDLLNQNNFNLLEFPILEELLEIIQSDSKLRPNAPARMATLLAILNNDSIGWKIPSALVRNSEMDCSREHVRILVDWAAGHQDRSLILKFVCVLDMICNGQNSQLSELKKELLELRGSDEQKIDAEDLRAGVLRKLSEEARILFSTSLPKGQNYCFLKWAGITRKIPIDTPASSDLEQVLGKGKHVAWLKQGKINVGQTPELSFIKPVRIEVFIDDGSFADRDWSGIEEGVTLGIPIFLRRMRDQDDFARLGGGPPVDLPEEIPCISGEQTIPIAENDRSRIVSSRFFLGSLANSADLRSKLFWYLSDHTLAGIWFRTPVSNNELQEVLREFAGKKLDEVSALLFSLVEKSPAIYKNCILFVDRDDGQFPPPRANRQRRFQKNTYR
jgi:hypothetical protein